MLTLLSYPLVYLVKSTYFLLLWKLKLLVPAQTCLEMFIFLHISLIKWRPCSVCFCYKLTWALRQRRSLADEFKEITDWNYIASVNLHNFRCQTWTDCRAFFFCCSVQSQVVVMEAGKGKQINHAWLWPFSIWSFKISCC